VKTDTQVLRLGIVRSRQGARGLPALFGAILFLSFATASGATFYWNGSGDVTLTSSWGTNTDGSGTQPANFTNAGQVFELQNGQNATLSGAWTISGSGSKLLVDSGATFNAGSNNPSITVDLSSGATYKASGTYTSLTFGTISATSTFDYSGPSASFRSSLGYGGLIWRSSTGTGTPGTFTTTGFFEIALNTAQVVAASSATSNTWTVDTDLSIDSSATLLLAGSSSSGNALVKIGGALTNSGTISRSALASGTATFEFNGTGSSNVTWGTNSGNFNVNVSSAAKTITMSDSLNNGTGTVGVTGTLNLGNGSKLNGTGTITVNSGGILSITATTGTDHISDTALIDLIGGTLSLGANSEATGNIVLEAGGSITSSGGTLTGGNYDVRSGTISANLAGSGVTLFKSTSGGLSITGINSYSGGTTINGGDVTFNNSSALGTAAINFGPNGLDSMSLMSTTAVSLSNNITINDLSATAGRTATLGSFSTASSGTNAYTGNITLSNDLRIKSSSPISNALTFSGVISGSGELIINPNGTISPGAVKFTGNNSYTGATIVNAGTLLVNGDQSTATGAVTVNNGGTLGGSGTIGGTVTMNSGATLAPGNSTGILHTGALTLSSGSTFTVELNNTTAGTGYDQVISSSAMTFNGSTLVVTVGGSLSIGQKFFILENISVLPNNPGVFTNGVTVSSGVYTFAINYADTGDGGITLNDISLEVTSVPEPTTWVGAALALCAVMLSQPKRLLRRLKQS
jgi:fibronectin-binding autotransporter adhesin